MAIDKTTRTTRRALLTGAAAALPAIPAMALPAVILPRPGLAMALQEHVDAIVRTCAPFAARRGMPEWAFTVSDYGDGMGGRLTMLLDDEPDAQGRLNNRRLESFKVRNGVLNMSIFQHKEETMRRFNVDFPV